MCLYITPEEHAANPPSTWRAVKRSTGSWALVDQPGVELERHTTKKAAEAAIEDGMARRQYDRDTRWFAGHTPPGMKSWAEVQAERERAAARRAAKESAA